MPTLAYLMNSHPMPSTTFIRREISALEEMGLPVVRYAVRDSGLPRPDPADQREYDLTRRLLDAEGLAAGLRAAEDGAHPLPAHALQESLDIAVLVAV